MTSTASIPRPIGLLLPAALAIALAGCGGSPTAPQRDDVFYLHGAGTIDKNYSYETYFKPLDRAADARHQRVVGVGVLNGDIRLGRPIDWNIRGANYAPQQRFISYQSPRQFLFSIYERVDPTEDTWTEVLRRYEADLEEQGAQVLAGRMPVATANTQGRAYLIKTKVPSKPDYLNYAHEIIIRGDRRLILIQIIHGENFEAIEDEIAAAFQSIIVY